MDIYAQRRARVLQRLRPDAVMMLVAAPELTIGRDTHLRYVVDPEIYYLTGYSEPEAVLLLDPSSKTPFTMFVRDRDVERELWLGKRAGVEGAQASFGADAAFPIAELTQQLSKRLVPANTVYARTSGRADTDVILQQLFASGRATRARSGKGAHIMRDPGDILDEMRLIKDESEIGLMREAARISVQAFGEAMPRVRSAEGEWQIEAHVEYGFRSRGAGGPAFPTIAAGGANATVLHYAENTARLQSGELLLLDAGARFQMYCADITRTVPIGGTFTKQQRELYDVVLAAHDAAISAIAPGRPYDDVHDAARAVLIDGLVKLGFLTEEQSAEDAPLRQFFPHKTSHWLGLEVHDVGAYALENGKQPLAPGMVLTVEPGLYIAQLGIGIRLEDDVLVTQTGHEVLTADLPIKADEVERLLQQ